MRDTYQIEIEKLVPGGDGLGRVNGKVVLVPFVIPGELVTIAVTEEKKEFCRGTAEKILRPSPFRVKPVCEYFGKCGGCHWQHIDYTEQLNQKTEVAMDAFTRIGKLQLQKPLIIPGKPYGYRNRAQFQYDRNGNLGFMEKGTNRVIDICNCPVLHPDCQLRLNQYRNLPPEHISHPEKRTGKIHVFAGGKYEMSQTQEGLSTKEEIAVTILDQTVRFGADCFFQSNLGMLSEFITLIQSWVGRGNIIMDLYCGVGLYSIFLEQRFKKIIAVEQSRSAIRFAQKNLPSSKTYFYAGNIENLEKERFSEKPDLVILNPPRTGLTSLARRLISRLNSPQVIYVSCNPVTLARDLKDLLLSDYYIQDIRLFDFYPQTAYVETVVKLSRNNEAGKREFLHN